jgi:hypothetical protein
MAQKKKAKFKGVRKEKVPQVPKATIPAERVLSRARARKHER